MVTWALPAGTQDMAQLPSVEGPLVRWIAGQKHAPRDSLANFDTDPARMQAFREFVGALADGNWTAAAAMQERLRYRLESLREGGSTFVVASDDSGTARDPFIVINPAPRTDMILEAPHVPFEPGTGEQAVMLLRDLGGRAAIISGAHRCASRAFTACSGRTAVCGTMQAYRDSDPAHNTGTLFDAAHRVLSERWNKSVVISLHGMANDRNGVTSVVIANGALAADEGARTTATKLRFALDDPARSGMVVSCNVPADRAFGFTRLCGYTNVQGRHLNGGADACLQNVAEANGRFIHMEQAPAIRQSYAAGEAGTFHRALVDALARELPKVEPR